MKIAEGGFDGGVEVMEWIEHGQLFLGNGCLSNRNRGSHSSKLRKAIAVLKKMKALDNGLTF